MHHNTLGYSGTDGNAVWVHDNDFYDNSMGFSTDVFTAPGHPGFPQDSDLLENNNFYSNNFNAYLPPCAGQPEARAPAGRTRAAPTSTPTEPVPVGTGMWIAGGNANVDPQQPLLGQLAPRRDALPGAGRLRLRRPEQPGGRLRSDGDRCPATSYRNQFYDNKMGQAPDGSAQPNGVDFWWDQGGVIVDPTPTAATAGTTTPARTAPPASVTGMPSPSGAAPNNLPSDCANSPSVGASTAQVAELLTCSTVPKGDPSCPWFTTPPKP